MDQKEATQENETHDMSYGKEIESKGGMLTSGASVTTEDNVSQIQHENDLPELSPTSQEVLTCDENEWINHEHTPEKEDETKTNEQEISTLSDKEERQSNSAENKERLEGEVDIDDEKRNLENDVSSLTTSDLSTVPEASPLVTSEASDVSTECGEPFGPSLCEEEGKYGDSAENEEILEGEVDIDDGRENLENDVSSMAKSDLSTIPEVSLLVTSEARDVSTECGKPFEHEEEKYDDSAKNKEKFEGEIDTETDDEEREKNNKENDVSSMSKSDLSTIPETSSFSASEASIMSTESSKPQRRKHQQHHYQSQVMEREISFDFSTIQYRNVGIFSACVDGDLPLVTLLLDRIIFPEQSSLGRRYGWATDEIPRIDSITQIIDLRDEQKNNPMHYAALSNNPEVVEYLLETEEMLQQEHPNQQRHPQKPHHLCRYRCHSRHQKLNSDNVSGLIDSKNEDGETALLRACTMGILPIIRTLIFHKSSLTTISKIKQNVIINAAKNNHYHVIHYILSLCPPQVYSTLLHQMDEDGHSALDWACNNGHLDTVEYLLYRGVNPFITDRYGRNALHWAARGPQMSVVGYLLALGMSPETPDHDGSTVLEMSKTNQALKDTIHSPAHACGYRAGATMGPSSVFINDRLSRIIPRERDDQLTKNDMEQKNIDLQGKHITELVRISLDDIPNINPNNHLSLCTELKVDNSSLIYGVHPSILRKNRLRIPYFAFFSLFTFFLGCIVLFTKWYISFTIFLLIGLIAFIINRGQKFLKRNTMPNGDVYEQNEANKNEALGIVGVICDTIASKYGARAVGLIGRLLQAHERLIGFWFGMCMVFGLIIFGGWIVHFRAERGVPEHLQLFVLEFIGESISEVFPYFIITTTSYIFTVISWFLLFTVYYDPGIVYISRAASYCSMLDSVNTTGLTPSRDSWCTATFHVKPFRAKYDAPTGLLVARFDHHCPWLNNAIGHRNHRIYIVFLFWHLLFMYSTLVWGLMTSLNEVKIEDTFLTRCELSERLLSRRVYGVVVVMLCSLLFGTGLTILFFLQIRNILENVTTNERINWRRYPYMKGAIDEMKFMNMNHDQFHNRFDTGSKWNNWKEFWLHQVDYYDSYNIPQGKHEEDLDDGDRSVSSDQQREDAASSTFATMM